MRVDNDIEAKKDKIARSRTSALSYEPSEPPQISVGTTEKLSLIM